LVTHHLAVGGNHFTGPALAHLELFLQTGDSLANYNVIVTWSCGTATSSNGALTVNADTTAPTIACPAGVNEEPRMTTPPQRIDLCAAADVAPGSALRVEAGDLALAVFNVEGEFYVTDDQCTHGPGLLSEGFVDGDLVECNFHNGQFNIKTGEVASPPCMVPIKTYRTIVENGRVYIDAA